MGNFLDFNQPCLNWPTLRNVQRPKKDSSNGLKIGFKGKKATIRVQSLIPFNLPTDSLYLPKRQPRDFIEASYSHGRLAIHLKYGQ